MIRRLRTVITLVLLAAPMLAPSAAAPTSGQSRNPSDTVAASAAPFCYVYGGRIYCF